MCILDLQNSSGRERATLGIIAAVKALTEAAKSLAQVGNAQLKLQSQQYLSSLFLLPTNNNHGVSSNAYDIDDDLDNHVR
jgi:hypothetical protein